MADFENLFTALVDQESRGRHLDKAGNLLSSPVGAQGVTQVMPKTGRDPGYGVAPIRDNSEAEYRRFGRDYLGAMLKEFGGDQAKALAAYNWGPGMVAKAAAKYGANWLDHAPDETKQYVSKITAAAGGNTQPAQAVQPVAAAPVEPVAQAAGAPVDYGLVPPQEHNPEVPPPVDPRSGLALNEARLLMAGQAVSNASADTAAWEAGVRQDLANEAGFLVTTGAAMSDPNVMFEVAAYNMLKNANQDGPVDPNWDFRGQYEKAMGSLTVEEREYLFENGGDGQQAFDTALQRIQDDRDMARLYANSGAVGTLASQLVAGFASPMNYVSGAVVGRALTAVAQASRIATAGAKAGLMVGENVIGNVAQEAMLDAMGERRTASDYALAAGMGAAFSVPFIPGAIRRGQAEAAEKSVQDMIEAGKRRMMGQREVEANADVKELQGITKEQGQPLSLGKVMPDEVDSMVRGLAGDEVKTPDGGTAKAEDFSFPTLGGGDEVRTRVKEFVDTLDLDAPDAPEKFDRFIKSQDWQDFLNDPEADPSTTIAVQNLEHGFSFGKSDSRAGEVAEVKTRYDWDPAARKAILEAPDLGGVYSAREVLEAVKKATFRMVNDITAMGERTFRGDNSGIAKWLLDNEKHLGEWLDRTPVALLDRKFGGQVQHRTGVAEVYTGSHVPKRLASESRSDFLARAMGSELMGRVALHELMHTRTIHAIDTFETNPNSLPKELRRSLGEMDKLRKRLAQEFRRTAPERLAGSNPSGAAYAVKDLHEFYSQLTASYGTETREMLSKMKPSPGFVGRVSSALDEVWLHIKAVLGLPHGAPRGTALGEALFHLERTVLFDQKITDASGRGLYEAWPAHRPSTMDEAAIAAQAAPGISPQAIVNQQQKFADRMYESARAWIAENPIDTSRLNTLVSKFGALVSDGVALARSANPILQQMASLVAEVSTGAAGRRPTVAIRATYLEEQLVGLGLRRYESAYSQWKQARGVNRAAGLWNDAAKGDLKQQFDREVYLEILDRQNSHYEGRVRQSTTDPHVKEAADSLEAGFQRGLDAQKQGNTIGSAGLPENSIGYIPRALDGRILHSDPTALPLLVDALSKHWKNTLGWEPDFAKQFANFYLERARTRALGNRNVDLTGASVDGTSVIRETLEEMASGAVTPDARDVANQALLALNRTAGSSQTKARLDIDMLQVLPNGRRIADYYTQNPMLLYRKYMHRVAGEVALTEFGVPGGRGVRYLREAVVLHKNPAEMATEDELAAFDRLTAQILGRPVPGEVVSQAATSFRLFASMARLGGAGITQFQEVWNAAHHIGLRSTLAALGQLPKMIGEVGRLKKGQRVGGVLGDLATLGGHVGMRDYLLVAPLDAPDQRSLTHGDDVGIVGRLLRAGSHLQQRMSFMQGIHAAQHRAMAEQIVLKAAKYLRNPALLQENGVVTKALADMGFDAGLVTRLAATVDQWATFDPDGNLLKLDVTQMPNRADAEAFMQAVHRGTRQIIQGTFAGETGAWAHNDWVKLLTQFRTFSIISADKQFARTRMNHGMGTAAGYMLGSMAASIPLHLARVQIAALGREDREEYVDRATSWQSLVQASMNYTALSGLGGDAVELAMVGYSGWSGNEVESVRGRGGSLTEQIPVVGVIEQGYRVAQGKGSVHDALNMLPGSRLPYMIPLMNLTRDSE